MRKTNPPVGCEQFRNPSMPEGFSLQREFQRTFETMAPDVKRTLSEFKKGFDDIARAAATPEILALRQMFQRMTSEMEPLRIQLQKALGPVRSLQQEFQQHQKEIARLREGFRPGEFERALETAVLVSDLSFPERSPQQRNAAAQALADRLTTYLANPRARRALLDLARSKSLKDKRAQELLKELFRTGLLLAGQDDAWTEQKIRDGSRGKTVKLIPANTDPGDFYRWLFQRARSHAEQILLEKPQPHDALRFVEQGKALHGEEHSTASPSDKMISEGTPESVLEEGEAKREAEARVLQLLKSASKQEAWLLRLAVHDDGDLIKVLERFDKTPDAARKLRERLRKKLLEIVPPQRKKRKKRSHESNLSHYSLSTFPKNVTFCMMFDL